MVTTAAQAQGPCRWRHIAVTASDGMVHIAIVPTRNDILNLKVGDLAPYIFGVGVVAEVYARRDDIHGKAFVCYYVEQEHGRISADAKEDVMCENIGWKVDWVGVEMDKLRAQCASKIAARADGAR